MKKAKIYLKNKKELNEYLKNLVKIKKNLFKKKKTPTATGKEQRAGYEDR